MPMSLCPLSSSTPACNKSVPDAPRSNGARILEPPAECVARLLADNRGIIDRADYDVQGIRLADLAVQARRQLVAAALVYTRQYRDVPDPIAEPNGILLAGHQPEIFHPGVWLKNFVLHQLARQHDAVAVNLVIDSDTIKTSSLRVPGGTVAKPRAAAVLFDSPSAEIPFQARTIQDPELFASFGRRAAERLAPLVADPMLRDFWPLAVECARRTQNLGQSLSQARHQWEGHWGLTTLEIPQSLVCCLPAFHQLTAHLLAHLPRLWEVYNCAIAEYRRKHHVRSHSHPAPELAAEGAWLEAPFWIWTADNPRRRRVFVQPRGDDMVVSDLQGLEVALRLSPESEADAAVAQLAELSGRGIHLRSRALLTTLAARVLLGDLFIHGIGGAKYDRLTDAMIQRFFCLESPTFLIVSGTRHLPIVHESATTDDLRAVRNRLRELEFHPEVYLDPPLQSAQNNGSARHIGLTKNGIGSPRLSRIKTVAAVVARFERQTSNFSPTLPIAARNWSLAVNCSARMRAEAVLSSREYGFCLYPEPTLRDFLLNYPASR